MNRALTWIWLFVVVVAVALAILRNGLFRLGIAARVDTVAARVDQARRLLVGLGVLGVLGVFVNAPAGAGDRDAALRHVLIDVQRLDDLLERIHAMTPLRTLRVAAVDLRAWLARSVAAVDDHAALRGVRCRVAPIAGPPS